MLERDKSVSSSISSDCTPLTAAVALIRALVRQPKILILDEASSSVDSATDQLIQRIIQSAFGSKGTTILSIAHRLATVAYYDRVMVMDQGTIVKVSFLIRLQ